jgi:hypothetical protein
VHFTRTAAVAAAFAALLIPATAHAVPAIGAAGRGPGQTTITLPVRDALARLTVLDEDRTG